MIDRATGSSESIVEPRQFDEYDCWESRRVSLLPKT